MTKPRLIADSANDNSIDGARLSDDSISNDKLSIGSVTNDKIASGIDGAKLLDNSVANSKLETGIDGAKLLDSSVTSAKLALGAVSSENISFVQAGTGAQEQSVQAKLRGAVSVLDFIPEVEHSAIKNSTSTYDATQDIQAALDAELSVYFPSGTYNVSIIRPRANSTLIGGGFSSVIMGTVILGDENLVNSSIRGITLLNLSFTLSDPLSSDYPVKIYLSPDFVISECSARGIFIDFAVRGIIKDCKLRRSNGWAIYGQNYVNGIIIKDNIITGGSAGGAINLRGPVTVGNITGNIIESSRDGIWLSSEPQSGPGLTAGNSNCVTITGNYLEQVTTPFRIGEVFSVFSSNISYNYVGNGPQSVISSRTSSFTFGRIRQCTVTNNRSALAGDGSENFMEFVINISNFIFEGNIIRGNRWGGTPSNALLLSGTFSTDQNILRSIGGLNYIDFDSSGVKRDAARSSETCVYVTREFKANETISSLSWAPSSELEFGGKIFGISIVEAVGSLAGCRLRIGDSTNFAKSVDINDLSTLSLTNGFVDLGATGDVYTTAENIINITAGSGSGSFRIKFFYRAM